MCLKFLLESNKENQQVVRELEVRGVANGAELEREFGVRADVRDGKLRVENANTTTTAASRGYTSSTWDRQTPPTTTSQQRPGERTYQIDREFYERNNQQHRQYQPSANNAVTSRPVRRASDSATSAASTTAERLASMTERFNRLDISNFARGLPIRTAQGHGQGLVNRVVQMPQAQSIRDAHFDVVEEDEGLEDDEDEDYDDGDDDGDEGEGDDEARRSRFVDVGEML